MKKFSNSLSKLLFLLTLISLNSSCNNGSDSKANNSMLVDTVNSVIIIDSSKMSIAKSIVDSSISASPEKIAIKPNTMPPKIILFSQENFTGESDSISLDNYFQGIKQAFTEAQLTKFAVTGIRSMKVPFGLCADVLYATNTFTKIPQPGSDVPFPYSAIIVNVRVNKYYSPGDYPAIEGSLTKPITITMYPWTDFYFSTDDPSVPSQIQYIGLTYKRNDQGYSKFGDSISLSSTKDVYTKSWFYQIPEGRKINVWLATGNGNYSWNYHIDTTNKLRVNLNINNNAILAPRNWVGVRASLN